VAEILQIKGKKVSKRKGIKKALINVSNYGTKSIIKDQISMSEK
jgi:hypothetical protein